MEIITDAMECRKTSMNWKFQWYFNWPSDETAEIENAWHNAWINSPYSNVFQQPTLARIWVENVARLRGERPVLLIAKDSDHTVYFPFTIRTQKWRRLWRRELHALGANLVFDYQSPLVEGPEMHESDWLTFWVGLYDSSQTIPIDFFQIEHLQKISGITDGNQPLFSKIKCKEVTVAPRINLRNVPSLDGILAHASPNHRSKIRRKMRAVLNLNPRLVIFSSTDLEEALKMFDTMLIAYDKQYGGKQHWHMFKDKRNINFYREMICIGLPAGWLHVSILEVGRNPVSWHIGFFWNRHFYWYKPCYGIDEEKILPGHLHIAFLLMNGLSDGWEVFDFTVGGERYKFSWATETQSIYQLSWFSSNRRGILHYWGHKATQVMRNKISQIL